MQLDLFAAQNKVQPLADGLVRLCGFAHSPALLPQIECITQVAPWRHMAVPGGGRMAVAMSNCGHLGWVADEGGYRYDPIDPLTGQHWPPIPEAFLALARSAATLAGFESFEPDACLINRYVCGAGLGLHRDHDEADLGHPIVSVSIGASAVFQWGGLQRRGPLRRVPLHDGDVLVWGGPARLTYHGVLPLVVANPLDVRVNLTFRRAG